MKKLLSLWVDGLNKKNIPLTQAVITPQSIKINAGALQWHMQNVVVGFKHIKVNVQNLFVLFH
jgi:hypothetical protein